jgi:bifunctional UDP-N-acetylglucosamine pyrophosphorylase / glucosamine-1-phosphate N-acetyltransferase
VVILAAGQGTRMRSKTPKLLHLICGWPMIVWPVAAARAAGASKIVVVDAPGEPLRSSLDSDVLLVVQEQALGTADAVRAAAEHLLTDAPVVVIAGDVPLITPETIAALAQTHEQADAGATILTAVLDDPTGYGRVVREADGGVLGVVETKQAGDATPEQLQIKETNTGIYAFDGAALIEALAGVGTDNAQGEFYLPDVLAILRAEGWTVATCALTESQETLGVNDRSQLAAVRAVAQRRIHERHMLGGATIISPEATVIDADVTLGEDVTIEPGTALHGHTRVGDGSTIGPHTTLRDVIVGRDSKVVHSYATEVTIANNVNVGPFSYLRPGTVLQDGSKAGAFVEIKNSDVGARSKVPHLSYIGDATIGEDSNLGASTITANYDGHQKHRTKIGSRVHTSVDTTFVAPVEIGDDAYTGAGSVISKDVPDGALGIARPRQTNIDGYAEKSRLRHGSDEPADTDAGSGHADAP